MRDFAPASVSLASRLMCCPLNLFIGTNCTMSRCAHIQSDRNERGGKRARQEADCAYRASLALVLQRSNVAILHEEICESDKRAEEVCESDKRARVNSVRTRPACTSLSMSLKSALPTPTMIIDIGLSEAATMLSKERDRPQMSDADRATRDRVCRGGRLTRRWSRSCR